MTPPTVWFDRAEYRRLSEPLPSRAEAQSRYDEFAREVRALRVRLGLRDVSFVVGCSYLDEAGVEREGVAPGHSGDNAQMAHLFAEGLSTALRLHHELLLQHHHTSREEAEAAANNNEETTDEEGGTL